MIVFFANMSLTIMLTLECQHDLSWLRRREQLSFLGPEDLKNRARSLLYSGITACVPI